MASTWIAYNELAWTEELLGDPAACEAEAGLCADLIERTARKPPANLLHLGCGAGGYDHVFKRHVAVTGVDLSCGMLARARAAHPDIEYLEGDMRTLRLGRRFDVVAIPDAIDYMASEEDLRQVFETAALHLGPDGVLLVVGKPAETFRNNNFAYAGERDGVEVTLLENNYIHPFRKHTYEATLVYLIRRRGELTIHTEQQVLGLFPEKTWDRLFAETGFAMEKVPLAGAYDPYLLGESEYPMTVFVGAKRQRQDGQ